MVVALRGMKEMDRYTDGVRRRAAHHGPNVYAVIPALRGYVECYGENIEAFEREGDVKNVSWFTSVASKKRYAFRYEHMNGGCIELRVNNTRGPLVATFNNTTANTDIFDVFEIL